MKTEKNEYKCERCAELSGCYKGKSGKGKSNCPCFSPKAKE